MSSNQIFGVRTVTSALHHFAMVSIGFWCAILAFGGPLGFAPAFGALLEEMRNYQSADQPRPRAFGRVFFGARHYWRQSLAVSIICTLIVAALIFIATQAPFPINILCIVLALWPAMFIQHVSHRLSLGQTALAGGPALFFLTAWLQLGACILWFVTTLLLTRWALPIYIALVPAAIGFAITRAEGPALKMMKRLPPEKSQI